MIKWILYLHKAVFFLQSEPKVFHCRDNLFFEFFIYQRIWLLLAIKILCYPCNPNQKCSIAGINSFLNPLYINESDSFWYPSIIMYRQDTFTADIPVDNGFFFGSTIGFLHWYSSLWFMGISYNYFLLFETVKQTVFWNGKTDIFLLKLLQKNGIL